ncbi:MAG TPA: asparagine synthase (glutamine-hydrolyzing) [Candidatus Eisenbacteria bacterium]|nr:asparagine synthase (glutamine-hydrolyzing) [Candidatus Eisenbacteria bacterium]
MCGIAGLVRHDERIDLGRLHHMARLLRHRGPDDEGIVLVDPARGTALAMGGPDTPRDVYASKHRYSPGAHPLDPSGAFRVGFAHRRLSIVDLSPAGHQPMCDPQGRCWIVYNGEIYNHVEIRQELEGLGVAFRSTSDTEVILAAYLQWGAACLERFNGMFALAIWDTRSRELFCARDRFGVKPFYYQWDGRGFAFASEPGALVLTQPRRITPRLAAIRDLVALDWVDHEAHTFFAGLMQLPGGHYLVLGERGLAIRRWWALDPSRRATGNPEAWLNEFAARFDDAVRLRLRADVEVGSCLSGGLDSSAVVTTAATMLERPIHAFTVAYDEGPAYDERSFVSATVEAARARSDVVVPDGTDFWDTFERLAERQDEPTAGPGVYSQWHVMALAHRHGLKVLLDGQGGDETLAGYWRYLPLRLRDLLAEGRFGEFARNLGPVADRLGLSTTLALVAEPLLPAQVFAPLRRQFGQGKDRALSASLRRLPEETLQPPGGYPTSVSRQQAFDTLQRLLPSLLRYEDRNSMAFSIETRLPFLDYRLVEFVFSLPDEQRLEGTTTKAIMRRALGGRIPPAVLRRQDKMGFETPTDVWLRSRFANDVRTRLLRDSPLHDWLEPAVLETELEEYLSGRRAIGLQIWRWLSLEAWGRRYIAGDPRVTERPLEVQTHPGLHKSYRQVIEMRARDEGPVERSTLQAG